MEFSGGPLDFTTLDLCVVKRPLIINITLQAHAGRFGIILLYIIVTTCCPSSAYFCQFNSLNPPALASNTKHYGPGHKAQLHPPKFPQLTFVTFIFYLLFLFFYPFPLPWWGQNAFTKARGRWAWIIDRSIALCRVFLWSFHGPWKEVEENWGPYKSKVVA